MAKSKTNKSAFVREVLAEIGALTENPPEGWRQKVEAALAKKKLKMHAVTIYQLRAKAIKDGVPNGTPANGTAKKSPGRPKGSTNKSSKKAATGTVKLDTLTVADLREINTFAEKFGGLDGLIEAASVIQSIPQGK